VKAERKKKRRKRQTTKPNTPLAENLRRTEVRKRSGKKK
jgi:hypothetical protein